MNRLRIAGVLLRPTDERGRAGQATVLVPVESVEAIVRMPRLTHVVGGQPPLVGIGAVMGSIVPILSLGAMPEDRGRKGSTRPPTPMARARGTSAPHSLVVCVHAGSRLGLTGAEIVSVGHFDAHPGDPEAAIVDGERVERVDLASLVARLHARPWAGRVRV